MASNKRMREDSTSEGSKRFKAGEDMETEDGGEQSTGVGSLGNDGRYLSLLAPSFRVSVTRRLTNTLTEGEFFWPLYQYMTPYVMGCKRAAGSTTYGPVNQVVDYLISANTPVFHQVTNIHTMCKISRLQSNVLSGVAAQETETVAGNSTPYLNIGRDTLNVYKSLGANANSIVATDAWTEAALRDPAGLGNSVYGCMHNGGVYTDTIESKGASTINLLEFGVQGPLSLFGEVQSLQSGSGGSWTQINNYRPPAGHAYVVPSLKGAIGNVAHATQPLCNARFPYPTAQASPINQIPAGVSVVTASNASTLRSETDIANINLNSGGEAVCLWINPLNPDQDPQQTRVQKLSINFVLEMTATFDVKINYTPTPLSGSAAIYQSGAAGGKIVAMPCQDVTATEQPYYWQFGDALRPQYQNNL